MTKTRLITCCLQDSELIEQYERYLYEHDVRDKELVEEALRLYLSSET